MKIQTNNATHNQIDWLVATIDGYSDWCGETETFLAPRPSRMRAPLYDLNYSTDPHQAWNLIETYRITITQAREVVASIWRPGDPLEDWYRFKQRGCTPLVAAMRTLIESLLGPNPDVPEGLK